MSQKTPENSLKSDQIYSVLPPSPYKKALHVQGQVWMVVPSIKTSLCIPAPTSALCLAAVSVLYGESDYFTGVVIVRRTSHSHPQFLMGDFQYKTETEYNWCS